MNENNLPDTLNINSDERFVLRQRDTSWRCCRCKHENHSNKEVCLGCQHDRCGKCTTLDV